MADCAVRNVLGPDVTIKLTAIDETNQRVNCDKLIAEMRSNGNFGIVGLVGVQSVPARARHCATVAGRRDSPWGSVESMFRDCSPCSPTLMPELQEALDMGISLFAGEAEGRMEEVLRDAAP